MHRSQRHQLSVRVVNRVVMLNPQSEEAAEADLRYPSAFLLTMKSLSFRCEPAERNKHSNVALCQKGEKRA